jgi:ParB family chromosome partitioning protein
VASVPSRGPRAFGLGRGLDALIPGNESDRGVLKIALHRIERNPDQPRAAFDETQLGELAASIAVHGVIQPVILRELADGGYQLVAGERRVRAAKLAGLETIPAVVRDADGETSSLELALIENLQREDLNAVEAALAYRELIDRFGLTHEAVARQIGKSRVAVSNALRLLDLAPETRAAIVDGRITEGHGRALAAITVAELQRAALAVVLERQLSVRQTEELVRRKRDDPSSTRRAPLTNDLADLEAQLRGVLATKVGIVRTRRGGRLVIDFYSDEELDRLYSIITRGAGGGAGGGAERAHNESDPVATAPALHEDLPHA